jgi:hypothetical protein
MFLIPILTKADSFTESFDSLDIGDLYGQNSDWIPNEAGKMYIIGNTLGYYNSFPYSLRWNQRTNQEMNNDLDANENITEGSFKFYTMFDDIFGTSSSGYLYLHSYDHANNECFWAYMVQGGSTFWERGFEWITYFGNPEEYYYFSSTTFSNKIWYPMEVQWDIDPSSTSQNRVRWKFNEGQWTDWRLFTSTYCYGINRLRFESYDGSVYPMYFDSFVGNNEISGWCGSGENCIFCGSQELCENNNCFWIIGAFEEYGFSSQCVEKEPITWEQASSTRNATSFYSEHSQYSTPTELYLGLTGVSGGVIDLLSSWLSTWTDFFDLSEAKVKGIEIGLSVPKMRGYLLMFNAIFGDLPIAEILFIYLIIIFAIVILKIIRYIKQLLPFQ